MKLTLIVSMASLALASCGGGTPSQIEKEDIVLPGVDQSSGSSTLQCISKLIKGSGIELRYRNIYFIVDSSGTEIIQSQSEGPKPCP
jgi:hypothetical protein